MPENPSKQIKFFFPYGILGPESAQNIIQNRFKTASKTRAVYQEV